MSAMHHPSARSGEVSIPGARVRYLREGVGTPCLVVGSSIYHPRTFSPPLRERLELIFVDMRDFVPRDPAFDLSQVTIDTYATDIDTVRQALGVDKMIIAGHSTAGLLALEYARRYPHYVAGVLVIDAPPIGSRDLQAASDYYWQTEASEERKSLLERNWSAITEDEWAQLDPSAQIVRAYIANAPKYWYDPTYDPGWLWDGVTLHSDSWEHLAGRLFATYDLAQGSAPIAAPGLVIHGRHSYIVPYTLWESEKGKLPQVTLHVFDSSGHTPQLEEPERFNQIVMDWVHHLSQ